MTDDVHLCAMVEGVETTLRIGLTLARVVVTAGFLKTKFGANDTPDRWLAAFCANADAIKAFASQRYRALGHGSVIIGAWN